MKKYIFFICSLFIMTNCNKIEKENKNQEQSQEENAIKIDSTIPNQQEIVEHQIDPSVYDDTPAYQNDIFDCEDPRILEMIYEKYPSYREIGITNIFTLNRNDVLKTCECEGVVDIFNGKGTGTVGIIEIVKYRAQLKDDGRIVGYVQFINPNKKDESRR